MGSVPKPPGRAVGHRRHLQVLPGTSSPPKRPVEVPPPLTTWLAETRAAWREFWTTSAAGRVVWTTDQTALRHLFTLYDERTRAAQAYRRRPYVRGSKKQPIPNPAYKVMQSLETSIGRLEAQFGIGMRARQALGLGDADEPTLDDLNSDLEVSEQADPRVVLKRQRGRK